MKALKYIIGIMVLVLSGCDDVEQRRCNKTNLFLPFIMPALPRLTNAERAVIQERRDAYNEALEEN